MNSDFSEPPFADRLLEWFDHHGRRDLPWQHDISPYRVWLSEIMLQQTQVNTVIPYFQRFVLDFPTIVELAEAPIDHVLHLWTGLGYYARARNLHKTAQLITNDYSEAFPADIKTLQTLPGIGRSTAGAICAIAFKQRAAILDGNVKRVLARYHTVPGWPGRSAVSRQLWDIAEHHTPDARIADYTQAIMDLGATLCTRSKPLCTECPLNSDCQALANGNPSQYPGKKPAKAQPVKSTLFLMLENPEGEILLQQRPHLGIWGGLWSFPECAQETDIEAVSKAMGHSAESWTIHRTEQHIFSHYRLNYTPVTVKVKPGPRIADNTSRWGNPGKPGKLGLPKPIKSLLGNFPPGD